MNKPLNCQRVICFLGLSFVLAGCTSVATTATNHSYIAPPQPLLQNVLPADAGKVLSEYSNDVVVEIESSKQRLESEPTYYSASGKNCRKVSLVNTINNQAEPRIACEYETNVWTLNKALP